MAAGLFLAAYLAPALSCTAQSYPANWLYKNWDAYWITMPGKSGREYGIYHFRKDLRLDSVPASYIVHISADNRYRLLVNGSVVGNGPAQGTPQNWVYDSYDLAPLLKAGNNIIACQVWNYGAYFPLVQMSVRTAFIMQGDSPNERSINTDASWKVTEDPAYAPMPVDTSRIREFFVVTPGDSVDGRRYPWGWETAGYDDSQWRHANLLFKGGPYGTGVDLIWQLVPRTVPYLVEDTVRFRTVRRVTGAGSPGGGPTADQASVVGFSQGFLSGKQSLVIPPHTTMKVLIDQDREITAYPELLVSGGKNAAITLTYVEALMDIRRLKGNRNDIEGKDLYGISDKFISDGGTGRLFRPLCFRSYRYLEMRVETQDEALSINDLYARYNHVPHVQQATFETSDSLLNRILETAWHTQDLCMKDYLLTDAYYEQLQYAGDNRIQELMLNSMGYDRALVKNMLYQYYNSRGPEGLTQSRYPCAVMQIIPTYSLLWINMLHDYWKYYKDEAFIREMLSGVYTVLDWYERKMDTTTWLVGKTEFFNFVDWTREWAWDNGVGLGGVPAGCSEGGSSIVSMQLVYALNDAAELFTFYHQQYLASKYKTMAARISKSVWEKCWDPKRQLLSDRSDKFYFSQHANIFGVLSNTIPSGLQQSVIRRVAMDTSLVQVSLYFRFYLGQAYKKAGLANEYMDLLHPWKIMLDDGLTTFAEVPGNAARSDCHPWSCSPLYEFYATICGINPVGPGFSSVEIKPALGSLQWVKATMIHEGGPLSVSLKRRGGAGVASASSGVEGRDGGIEGEILLPGQLKGDFVWNGQRVALHAGRNVIRL